MTRISVILTVCLLLLAACDQSKPKPISNNIEKTRVIVNGKKDSVINNPAKIYGTATVPEPCVKCLLQVIQKSDSYKKATGSVQHDHIIYAIDWVSRKNPAPQVNGNTISNGMQVNIMQKADSQRVNLSTYLFDNSNSKLYLLGGKMKYEADPIAIDSISLKKIRNSCFWGVASAK